MMVRSRKPGGSRAAKHQNSVVVVEAVLRDAVLGTGILGRNLLTHRTVAYFNNPVLSEAAKTAKFRKTIDDFVTGTIIAKNKFTIDVGDVVALNRIEFNPAVPTFEGHPVEFVEWIRIWTWAEARAKGEAKQCLACYAIPQSRMTRPADGVVSHEYCRVDVFRPQGDPENPLGPDTQVVNSFTDPAALLSFVENDPGGFDSYMVRMTTEVDGVTHVACTGEFVRAEDWRNPGRSRGETFAESLGRALGVTWQGLVQFLSMPGYTLSLYGLTNLTPGQVAGERAPSMADQILDNLTLIPRDAPRADNGTQNNYLAIPAALRGGFDENGTFWIDRLVNLGKTGFFEGRIDPEQSESIDADSYSGAPAIDEDGEIVERGLPRVLPPFDMGDGTVREANFLWELAELMGCERPDFPKGRFSAAVWTEAWKPQWHKPVPAAPQAVAAKPAQTQVKPVQTQAQAKPAATAAKPAATAAKPAAAARPQVAGRPGQAFAKPARQPQAAPAAEPLGQGFDEGDDIPF
jgi:hypothetical protein